MGYRDMNKRLLDRREFNLLSVAASLSLSSLGAPVAAQENSSSAAPTTVERTVKFRDGTAVPAVGQGSAGLAQGRRPNAVEEEALRTGISLGMTVIDTAEGYGETPGGAEKLIGQVIAGQRDRVFLVSKVTPFHVDADGIARSCEASLARLGTDHLDLYLLHWRDRDTDLSKVVAGFESLRARGKIRAWGVSNFKLSDMEDLIRVPDGHRCGTNQVRYSLEHRAIDYDLLPWCQQYGMPVMAYSPLGIGSLVQDPTLRRIGAAHHCAATAVALAWAIRTGNVIAIPESGLASHVKENAAALSLMLSAQELQTLDLAHPLTWLDFLRYLVDGSKQWLHHVEDML